jgi:YgiT-type zinc finger domain-containing protein
MDVEIIRQAVASDRTVLRSGPGQMGVRLEDPKEGARAVKHEYAACSFCGGPVEERLVSVDYRTKAGLVIIENVPAGVCRQCGERYYTAEVAKAMERLAEAEVPASRTVAVPVREFSTSAAV